MKANTPALSMVPLSPLPDKAWPELQRQRRALLVADVVESVRLMLDDEPGQIERWRRFVDEVQRQVLPATGGRLVKSLGDGFLLEFDTVPQAVKASLDMQGLAQAEAPMQLRIGIHAADVVVDELDLWGTGVNLVSRVAALAGPGEIVVTSEARDQLWAGWMPRSRIWGIATSSIFRSPCGSIASVRPAPSRSWNRPPRPPCYRRRSPSFPLIARHSR